MTPVEVAAVGAAISQTLNFVITKLAPSVIEWYSSIGGVPKDLEELLEDVKVIRGWMQETGYEVMVNDPYFDWLKSLREVAYDVEDVVDEFQLQAEKHEAGADRGSLSKYMRTKTKIFNLQCKAANKIKTIKKRFASIVKKRSDFSAIANSLQIGHPLRHMNETTVEMPSLPIVDAASVLGRDQDKDKIITELVKSNGHKEIAIISVTGLGGSGKTTLAQLIFNDTETLQNNFEFKLWVYVSQEFNVGKLIEKLFEAVTKEKSDKYPLQHLSEEISKRLNGKKFLLVLDDVWTGDRIQWEQFMVHLKSGAPESKILVTTRSRRVAQAMGSVPIFDLPFLSLDDSWQLFHRSFGEGVQRLSSDFLVVGKEIVKKCGGMPLAIKSLAGVLSISAIKPRIEDWQAIRDNNLLDVQGEEHIVAAFLRLSYSRLPYNLKPCFTICSVFPKGHEMDKEQLIDLWIAHDMISLEDGVAYSEYIVHGNRHFNSLVQISFLQNLEEKDGKVTCIMHDLVHDFAQLILGDQISLEVPKEGKYLTKRYRYFSLSEQPEDIVVPTNIFEKARAVYITKCYDYIFGMAMENAKHLRSVTIGSPYVTALPNCVFQINNLKYLSMSRLNCEALPDSLSDIWSLQALHITDSLYLLGLPESIDKLKRLRTLNLSGCQFLNRLPDSIGECHVISKIDLWNCIDLTVLPNSIGRNKELRVLRLGGCTGLKRLPNISTLESLQCLDLRSCDKLEGLLEGIENLKKLETLNLEGCTASISLLALKAHQLVQNLNISVVGRSQKNLPKSLLATICLVIPNDRSFVNTYVTEDDVHKTTLKDKTNLQGLNLMWTAHDTTEVDNEYVQGVLDDLEPPHGIKELKIHWYSGRQYARWMQNQVGAGVQGPAPFPFLRVVKLCNFPNLKHLHGLVELPCLEELELKHMPSLESIGGGPFPSLVKLEMHDLPCLGEVWMAAEWTMPDGEEVGGCCNFAPQLRQFRVGNCLTVLKISDCPKLEVKPPLLVQRLKLSPGQCEGSSSSPSFSHLKELRLQNVKVVGSGHGLELLQHMTTLESLEIINFSGVQTELPESLWELQSLQELTIKYCNSLSSLPQSMGHLTCLRKLAIKSCKALEHLPDCLGELCSLYKLEITDLPKLTCLPESISHLTTSLRELEIAGCLGITSLPQGMEGLVSLEKLIIWSTGLISLPQGMEGLVSLEKLIITNCRKLTSLPQGMEGLASLQELEIFYCTGLTSLPQGIEGLTSLKNLSIINCPGLTSLPQGIKGLVSLEELCVGSCPGVKSLPEGIKGLTALKKLRIYNCPYLERRCKRGKGEDWHLISHIPHLSFDLEGFGCGRVGRIWSDWVQVLSLIQPAEEICTCSHLIMGNLQLELCNYLLPRPLLLLVMPA